MATSTKSVVELIKTDHQSIKEMWGRLEGTPVQELENYFCEVRETLVRHEVAEELIVYPAFREHVPGGDTIADACIKEQSEAEQVLAELEGQKSDTTEFKEKLEALKHDVLEHAQHEERDVLSALERHLSETDLDTLGRRYEKALQAAPTHPHPHAPDTPPGNVVLGPVAALVDKMRDAMSKAT